MLYLWLDESDRNGRYYSNFYGGILIDSENYEDVLARMRAAVEDNNIHEEIKWQKVNEFTLEAYMNLMDELFAMIKEEMIKIRIFFHHNQYVPTGLTPIQRRQTYSRLYYQFIKYAFGFRYCNDSAKTVKLRLLIDDMPLKGEERAEFVHYLYQLNTTQEFQQGKVCIIDDGIAEVDSKTHLPLQFMDVVLGSMCFKLNDKHKDKNPETNKRGKRTIAKEKLYKHINQLIRALYPNFNIGVSTGIRKESDRWSQGYRHWSFKPSDRERDASRTKKQQNNPAQPNE